MTASSPDDLDLDGPLDLDVDAPPRAPPRQADAAWKMLHPASLLVNLIPRAWSLVRGLWPLLLLIVVGGRADGSELADLSFLVVFFAFAVANTFVHYATLRYRMSPGRLEIRSGLLNRTKRVLSPSKVQNVEMVRNVFHRATGLVEVRIETASGDEVEGLLSALTVQEGQALVDALSSDRGAVSDTDTVAPPMVAHGAWDLFRYGATSTRFGATLVGVGVLLDVGGVLDPDRLGETLVAFQAPLIVAGFLFALVASWGLGVAGAMIRHHDFSLRTERDALVAQEGLFTRRRTELPVRKVQRVALQEPWLRRLAGFGSLVIESAAARAGSGGTQRSAAMVPVVPSGEADHLVREALPRADVALTGIQLRPPHPRALRRALLRGSAQSLVIRGLATWWWWPWGAIVWLTSPLPPIFAWLDWRYQGWLVTDEVVVSRRGYLSRTTTIVARDKLQSVDVDQGPLLRRYRLGEVMLRVAGGRIRMPVLDHDEAFGLAAHLSATAGRASGGA